jgi:hypothetical protein
MAPRKLSTNTRIYCDVGSVYAKQLGATGAQFYVLAWDPGEKRVLAKKARIEGTARDVVIRVRTNVGTYEVSQEQHFRLHDGRVVPGVEVKAGDQLQSCELENVEGFIYVQTGQGPVPLHELVDTEMSGMFRLSLPENVKAKHQTIQEVIEVTEAGIAEQHYIKIECFSKNDASAQSGHNFLAWCDGSSFGSGIFIH